MTDAPSDSLAEIERCIADLKARLPKHSSPPSMRIELEELEEALAAAQQQAAEAGAT